MREVAGEGGRQRAHLDGLRREPVEAQPARRAAVAGAAVLHRQRHPAVGVDEGRAGRTRAVMRGPHRIRRVRRPGALQRVGPGHVQFALVALVGPDDGIEHPPAPLMPQQRGIDRMHAGQQRADPFPALPALGAIHRAVQGDLGGLAGLRHHPDLALVLEDEGIGEVEGLAQHRLGRAPGAVGQVQREALQVGAFGPVVEVLDEDMERVALAQREGVGVVAPVAGFRHPDDAVAQLAQALGAEAVQALGDDADGPEIRLRPLNHGRLPRSARQGPGS